MQDDIPPSLNYQPSYEIIRLPLVLLFFQSARNTSITFKIEEEEEEGSAADEVEDETEDDHIEDEKLTLTIKDVKVSFILFIFFLLFLYNPAISVLQLFGPVVY